MNDIEYDIIDELYFVTSFNELKSSMFMMPDEYIRDHLKNLINSGYVKCFYPDPDTEVELKENNFNENFYNYYFLATKSGLLAHNSR